MAIDDPVDWKIDLTTGELTDPPEYVTGVAAVVQGIVIRLRILGGELFYDTTVGLDYLPRDGRATSAFGRGGRTITSEEAILGGKFDPTRHRRDFRELIESVPGVNSVVQLDMSFDGQSRTPSVDFRVDTIYGLSDLVGAAIPVP
jgi:hypothetical protein